MATLPNILYILADDLGHGMLSCYGQKHFSTPNIDRIASDGLRFTNAYGTPFCATARATLITGIHDAHAGRWTFNRGGVYHDLTDGKRTQREIQELIVNTGIQPRVDQLFLGTIAQRAGYATGQIGKLEWGFSTSDADIRSHGWGYHYGYYCHLQCHGFYPRYVFEDGRRIDIPGNTHRNFGAGTYSPSKDGIVPHDPDGRAVHSQDLFDERLLTFIRSHRDRPFLLYHPSQLPHGPTYFPDHHPEVSANPDLNPIEREFASMILRLDRTVGLILDELERLGLAESTLVMLSSDNGHYPIYETIGRSSASRTLDGAEIDNITTAFTSARCGDVFDGNGNLAGLKTTNWEGGARVPLLARWPGVISPGRTSTHLCAHYDILATLAEIGGLTLARDATDGISLLGALREVEGAPKHDHVVYASYLGPSLVTRDGWKLRTHVRLDAVANFSTFGALLSDLRGVTWQLYHLPSDPQESHERSASDPQVLARLRATLLRECDGNLIHGTPEAHFAFYADTV